MVAADSTVRVAAAQFAVGVDVERNLESCLHWIAEAGKCKPDLVVLPEFANHASWYDDQAHCHAVSIDLDGAFVAAIAKAAREINAYVVVNATLRRGGDAPSALPSSADDFGEKRPGEPAVGRATGVQV